MSYILTDIRDDDRIKTTTISTTLTLIAAATTGITIRIARGADDTRRNIDRG